MNTQVDSSFRPHRGAVLGRVRIWRCICSVTAFLITLIFALSARGHSAPGTAVLLDFHLDRVDAELRLPLSELELSFRQPLEAEPATVVARYREFLAAYVLQHITVRSPEGQDWKIEVRAMHVALAEKPIDLVVELGLRPPVGASPRRFILRYDVISHEVMNHIALVSVRSDWNNSLLGDRPELLGALRSFAREIKIDRTSGRAWRGFLSVFELGMRHIAEGRDHLLFLLVLLLPAPLLVSERRWAGCRDARHSVVGLAKIVTAFTVGHSLTLIIGALGWLRLPAQLIEVLVAVSILVSAAHALRPVFAGREPYVAAGFGLVHGLAFASVLMGFQLDAWHLAAALLAFNLGIEIMQLVIVALAVPCLVLLSQSRGYIIIRIGGAIFGGVSALGWIAERALGWSNPFSTVLDLLAVHAIWTVATLASVALIIIFRIRRSAVV